MNKYSEAELIDLDSVELPPKPIPTSAKEIKFVNYYSTILQQLQATPQIYRRNADGTVTLESF